MVDITDLSNPISFYTPKYNCITTDGGFYYNCKRSAYDAPIVIGNISYVVNKDEKRLEIQNISNPTTPIVIGFLPLYGSFFKVAINPKGNLIYIISYEEFWDKSGYDRPEVLQIDIFDVTDPANPALIETVYPTPENSGTINGNIEYKAKDGTFWASDISNPSKPVIIGRLDKPFPTTDAIVAENKAYMLDTTGVYIYPVPVEVKPVTLKSDTSISVTLPSPQIPGNYIIRVFNSTGGSELVGAVTFTDKYSMKNSKAIIVAGSGPSFNIWNPIKIGTDTAYKAMKSQGYDNDSIYYLSANPADVTATCLKDTEICVDGQATYANLSYAINTWVNQNTPASELMIYFAGHGDNGIFQVNATEQLTVQNLDSWLDSLQTIMSGRVTFVYDACYSGSFVKQYFGQFSCCDSSEIYNLLICVSRFY